MKLGLLRKYGYSLRGKPATKEALLVRGERVSAIAYMTIKGILDVKTHKETSNGDIFMTTFTPILFHTYARSMDTVVDQLLYLTIAQYTTVQRFVALSEILEL